MSVLSLAFHQATCIAVQRIQPILWRGDASPDSSCGALAMAKLPTVGGLPSTQPVWMDDRTSFDGLPN